ncbi:MAG TPA: hypothetical protein PLL33_13490 [Paracoccus sp. (in: a-proteobacteria)]|nr:hypothetical protein [Paracoccus sp. (in: a-proteobacteria)]
MPVTIHLGAHKTATTHLQTSLRQALPHLLAAGVWYADMMQMRAGHFPVQSALGDRPRRVVPPRVMQTLDRAADIWPELLLSDENILGGTRSERLMGRDGRLYPLADDRMARLARLLRHRPMRLFLSVREPADFLASAFAMQVAAGTALEPAAFLRGVVPEMLSWSDLAARLLAVPGVTGLTVWRYEDYRRLRPALLARLLPAEAAARVGDPPAVNLGLSQQAYDAFCERAMADADADLRDLVARARRQFPRKPGAPGVRIFDDAARARSAVAHAADLARLAALPGADILQP